MTIKSIWLDHNLKNQRQISIQIIEYYNFSESSYISRSRRKIEDINCSCWQRGLEQVAEWIKRAGQGALAEKSESCKNHGEPVVQIPQEHFKSLLLLLKSEL